MAYTKVSSIITNGSHLDVTAGNPVAWHYFFDTFLPTVGWTATARADNSSTAPASDSDTTTYFLKKTLTFTDGTTDTISFAWRIEPGANRITLYSWDGVLATNDSSDPQYGRGSSKFTVYPDNVIGRNAGTFDIWKDANSDSFVWLKDGTFIGAWLPDGGWVRQDFVYSPDVEAISTQSHLFPVFVSGRHVSYNDTYGYLQTGLPIDTPNIDKLTNYISLTSDNYAVWLNTSNDILMRASRTECRQTGELLQLGSSSPYDYYYGMTDGSAGKGLYFNFGTTDPGY